MTLKSSVSLALVAAVAGVPAVATAQTSTAPAVAPLPPGIIAPGVSVEGVDIAGLTAQQATARILSEVVGPKRRPLVVSIRGVRSSIDPAKVGYSALVSRAVAGALNVARTQPPGPVDIPLTERLDRKRLRAVLDLRGARRAVAARDAAVSYSGGAVRIRRARVGIALDTDRALAPVERDILSGARGTVLTLPMRRVRAAVPRVPTTVIIDRGRFRLFVVRASGVRTFRVAVGQPAYPTPGGTFSVVNMQRNPTWTPPDSRWAAGLGPVPPGPGNPLGTRWIGISSPGIGIHGTPADSSIGTRASHGCIRMHIPDVERVFSMVSVGTTVRIV
jgi:lipoprotein-anchoring transpeptidase ErfK/SrfK